MGNIHKNCVEELIISLYGNVKSLVNINFGEDVFSVRRRGNSQKPHELKAFIDQRFSRDTCKIELFGRMNNLAEGWAVIENELVESK